MTFTLVEFLTGGSISTVVVAFFVLLKERKARREEVAEVSAEWKTAQYKAVEEWKKSYRNLLEEKEKSEEVATNYQRTQRELIAQKTEQSNRFKEGLEKIAKRKYLQIGQMKAPGATFSPPWEIAEEYLKQGGNIHG